MLARRFVPLCCVLAFGCSTGEAPNEPTKTKAPRSASAAAKPPPPAPTAMEEVTFSTTDDLDLSGRLYLAADERAPLLVMVHRFRGDSREWMPLERRMARAGKRYSMLAFDLRGHGRSKMLGKGSIDAVDMKAHHMPELVSDVRSAIQFGLDRTNGGARGVVLLGSSLGAALVAKAAGEEGMVTAIGVVSPGAAINGFDVYRPFAQVRTLPSFIASGENDNVSREPAASLAKMAKEAGTVKTYPGAAHGAHGLGREKNALWADLEAWLTRVFDEKPVSGRAPMAANEAQVGVTSERR